MGEEKPTFLLPQSRIHYPLSASCDITRRLRCAISYKGILREQLFQHPLNKRDFKHGDLECKPDTDKVCCQEAEFFIVKKEGQQTLIVESFLDDSQARTWNDKTLLGICRQHYIRLAQIASFARNAKNALQTLSMVALYGYDPSSLVKLGELLQNLGASAANGQYLQGLAQAILDKAEVQRALFGYSHRIFGFLSASASVGVAFSPLLKNLMRVLTDERTINTDGLETAQSDSELYQMIKRANPKLEQSKIINMVNSLSRAANIMQSPAASYAYQVASGLYSMIVKGLNFDGELIQKVLNTKYVSGLIDRSASFLSGSQEETRGKTFWKQMQRMGLYSLLKSTVYFTALHNKIVENNNIPIFDTEIIADAFADQYHASSLAPSLSFAMSTLVDAVVLHRLEGEKRESLRDLVDQISSFVAYSATESAQRAFAIQKYSRTEEEIAKFRTSEIQTPPEVRKEAAQRVNEWTQRLERGQVLEAADNMQAALNLCALAQKRTPGQNDSAQALGYAFGVPELTRNCQQLLPEWNTAIAATSVASQVTRKVCIQSLLERISGSSIQQAIESCTRNQTLVDLDRQIQQNLRQIDGSIGSIDSLDLTLEQVSRTIGNRELEIKKMQTEIDSIAVYEQDSDFYKIKEFLERQKSKPEVVEALKDLDFSKKENNLNVFLNYVEKHHGEIVKEVFNKEYTYLANAVKGLIHSQDPYQSDNLILSLQTQFFQAQNRYHEQQLKKKDFETLSSEKTSWEASLESVKSLKISLQENAQRLAESFRALPKLAQKAAPEISSQLGIDRALKESESLGLSLRQELERRIAPEHLDAAVNQAVASLRRIALMETLNISSSNLPQGIESLEPDQIVLRLAQTHSTDMIKAADIQNRTMASITNFQVALKAEAQRNETQQSLIDSFVDAVRDLNSLKQADPSLLQAISLTLRRIASSGLERAQWIFAQSKQQGANLATVSLDLVDKCRSLVSLGPKEKSEMIQQIVSEFERVAARLQSSSLGFDEMMAALHSAGVSPRIVRTAQKTPLDVQSQADKISDERVRMALVKTAEGEGPYKNLKEALFEDLLEPEELKTVLQMGRAQRFTEQVVRSSPMAEIQGEQKPAADLRLSTAQAVLVDPRGSGPNIARIMRTMEPNDQKAFAARLVHEIEGESYKIDGYNSQGYIDVFSQKGLLVDGLQSFPSEWKKAKNWLQVAEQVVLANSEEKQDKVKVYLPAIQMVIQTLLPSASSLGGTSTIPSAQHVLELYEQTKSFDVVMNGQVLRAVAIWCWNTSEAYENPKTREIKFAPRGFEHFFGVNSIAFQQETVDDKLSLVFQDAIQLARLVQESRNDAEMVLQPNDRITWTILDLTYEQIRIACLMYASSARFSNKVGNVRPVFDQVNEMFLHTCGPQVLRRYDPTLQVGEEDLIVIEQNAGLQKFVEVEPPSQQSKKDE